MHLSIGFELEALAASVVQIVTSKNVSYLRPLAAGEKLTISPTIQVYGDRMDPDTQQQLFTPITDPKAHLGLHTEEGDVYKITASTYEKLDGIKNDLEFVITYSNTQEVDDVKPYIDQHFKKALSEISILFMNSDTKLISEIHLYRGNTIIQKDFPLPYRYLLFPFRDKKKVLLSSFPSSMMFTNAYFNPQMTLGFPLIEALNVVSQVYANLPQFEDDVFMNLIEVCRMQVQYFQNHVKLQNFFFLFVVHLLTANKARKYLSEIIVRDSFQNLKKLLTVAERQRISEALVNFENDFPDLVRSITDFMHTEYAEFNFHTNVVNLGIDILERNEKSLKKMYSRQFLVDVGLVPYEQHQHGARVFLEFRAFANMYTGNDNEYPSLQWFYTRTEPLMFTTPT